MSNYKTNLSKLLIYSMYETYEDLAIKLIETFTDDIDVNYIDKKSSYITSYTYPLLSAFMYGYINIAKLLLTYPNLNVNNFMIPISDYQRYNKNIYYSNNILCFACYRGIEYKYINIVKLLLMHPNIDVNYKYKNDYEEDYGEDHTPLLIACTYGRIEIVKLLLKHPNIEINYRGKFQIPLHIACIYGSIEIVKLLLNHPNIDIETTDAQGKTALYYASNNNDIKKLLQNFKNSKINNQKL